MLDYTKFNTRAGWDFYLLEDDTPYVSIKTFAHMLGELWEDVEEKIECGDYRYVLSINDVNNIGKKLYLSGRNITLLHPIQQRVILAKSGQIKGDDFNTVSYQAVLRLSRSIYLPKLIRPYTFKEWVNRNCADL